MGERIAHKKKYPCSRHTMGRRGVQDLCELKKARCEHKKVLKKQHWYRCKHKRYRCKLRRYRFELTEAKKKQKQV
jgi:hypothetical protein